jgi:hypothetical protein
LGFELRVTQNSKLKTQNSKLKTQNLTPPQYKSRFDAFRTAFVFYKYLKINYLQAIVDLKNALNFVHHKKSNHYEKST